MTRVAKRVQHWRWEYRLRERPHVLVAAVDDVLQTLRLSLQAHWLLTITGERPHALLLACALLPSRIVVDASLPDALLLVEHLKRQRGTVSLPVLFLARNSPQAQEAQHRGAEHALITDHPLVDAEVIALHAALTELGALIEKPCVSKPEKGGESQ